MSRRYKLIAKLVQRPADADFGDVRAVLQQFGWAFDRQRGSHASFVKAGERTITVPVHGEKVGRRYLDDICERLGLDEMEG